MVNFWKLVNDVIYKCDVIIEVLDARLWQETRNTELEEKIAAQGKKLLFVINKSDLVSFEKCQMIKKSLKNAVFVSGKKHLGTNKLREKLMSMSGSLDALTVGVVGYPNVGKSSVINMLKGKGSAKVSPTSGQTVGKQNISVSKRLKLIDTPGVLPFREDDPLKFILIASETNKIKEPDVAAMTILGLFKDDPASLKEMYAVEYDDDLDVLLEKVAIARGKLKKGGEPDTNLMARMIIQDWQTGKLKLG